MASSGSSASFASTTSSKAMSFEHFPPNIYSAVHGDVLFVLDQDRIIKLNATLGCYWKVYSDAMDISKEFASEILHGLGSKMLQHAIDARNDMEAEMAAIEAAAKAAAAAAEAAELAAATAMDLADVDMTDAEIVDSEARKFADLREVNFKAVAKAVKAKATGAGWC